MATHNVSKATLKEKLRFAKSKNKEQLWVIHDLRVKVRRLEKQVVKLDKCIIEVREEAENRIAIAKENEKAAKVITFQAKRNNTNTRNSRMKMKRDLRNLMRSVTFLDSELSWGDEVSKGRQIEIIIRAIVAYTQLINDETITYSEFIFLLLGSQREFFNIRDVRDRIGKLELHYRRDFKMCLSAGYFAKIQRKPLYHITAVGSNRLEAILQHIYTVKIGTYKEVKRVLDKI